MKTRPLWSRPRSKLQMADKLLEIAQLVIRDTNSADTWREIGSALRMLASYVDRLEEMSRESEAP